MRIKICIQAIALILATCFTCFAQRNPYKEIGKKAPRILTLTNGEYEEFFDDEDVQQIGTILFDIRTGDIVKLLTKEEAEKRLENTVVQRFLSVDPLTRGYPELSPYQYASNTPIWAIDLDGMEGAISMPDAKTGTFFTNTVQGFKNWWYTPASISQKRGMASQVSSTQYDLTLTSDDFKDLTRGEYYLMTYLFSQAYRNTPGKLRFPSPKNLKQPQTPKASINPNEGTVKAVNVHSNDIPGQTNKQVTSANGGNTGAFESASSASELMIAPYKDATKVNAGKGLSADHIPSFGALKTAEEAKLGRSLTAMEEKTLRQNSLTLTIETRLHQTTSETYGGRNTNARQKVDAANPIEAIRSNINVYRSELLKQGYTDSDINSAIERLSIPFKQK